MAEPNSDADANKNVDDDPKEVSGVAPTLDQVHAMNQAKVEEEDATNEGNANDDGDAGGADSAEDDSGDANDDGGSDDGDGDASAEDENASDSTASSDGSGEDSSASEDKSTGTASTDTTGQSAPELNTDTSKPGDGKIAIKDADGATHYFNNRGEMPEDFEPANYKALMDAASEFAKKEIADEATAAETDAKARIDAEAADAKARTDAMEADWERDASDLSSAGFLPKDAKKLETAKEEVYTYIEKELKAGNVITNFKQAYKSMMYDKEQEAKTAEQKKIDQAKKDRGSIVQGGGSSGASATGSTRGKVIEGPPTGVGLDAVHARAIDQLNP